MKTLARKIALAAAVAAMAPAAARAGEQPQPVRRMLVEPAAMIGVDARPGEGDRSGPGWREDRDREGWRGDRDGDRWRRREPGWTAWRARERAQLRVEYARLDEARQRFYAWPHRPWRVRQFEAWYAHEHAELEARWARVS